MSKMEKQKWRHDDEFDSDSNISTKLPKAEDDDKTPASLLNLPTIDRFNSSFSQKRSNPEKERHAELFRKDLISAMKLPDYEVLQPEEYFQILDPWKLEWERGVQVPINPGGIIPSSVRVIEENENLFGPAAFKLPKKFLHAGQDDSFKPAVHESHEVQKLMEQMCRYDLDDLDISWLQNFNQLRDETGDDPLTELDMEKVIEEMETRCHTKLQQAQRTIQGLGIEYDENVVCDVCRSPEGEDSNEMVFCDSCDICVHQACYGIQMIPEGNWLCRVCALGIKPQCVLCPNPGGAMKSTKSGNEWAHISCALWIPEVHIGDPEKMEPVNNINQIPASRWALVCTLCRERQGACIQCSVKSCKTSFHVTCAFQNNLEMHQTYDEELGDVQMKPYCPKHSGQRNDDSMNEDASFVASPKSSCRPELTEEEKTELRSHRLKKLEEEFWSYISPKEVAEALTLDVDTVNFVYNYWVVKRKSQFNRPLLMPKLEEGDLLLKQREDGLVARLKMFIHLRQELERVRNLCYMVNKREKLSRQMYRMKEDIFALLAKTVGEDACQDDPAIRNSHRMTNTIYDHPDGILRAARLMEQMEMTAEAQEANVSSLDKDGDISKQLEKPDNNPVISGVRVSSNSSLEGLVEDINEEFRDPGDEVTGAAVVLPVEITMDMSDLEPCSKPISIDIFEVKDDSSCDGDIKAAADWFTNNFKEFSDNGDVEIEKVSSEASLPASEFSAGQNLGVTEVFSTKFDDLKTDGDPSNESREIVQPLQSLSDTGWVDDRDDNISEIIDLTSDTPFQSEASQSVDDAPSASAIEIADDLVGDLARSSPCLLLNHSIIDEALGSCKNLPQNSVSAPEKPTTVKSKRAFPLDGVRRSKRYKRTDENMDLPMIETKDSPSVLLRSDSSFLIDRGTDLSFQNSLNFAPETSRNSPDENIIKKSSSISNLTSGNSAVSSVAKIEDGWSSIRHKLSPNSKLHGSEILKRFSPEQLIVSQEIKQRVERCLLNLPCLKSFNGLCKHLHQKLAACNLHYPKRGSDSPKMLDDVKERSSHTNPSSLTRSANSALKKSVFDSRYEPISYSKSEHRTKISSSIDEEWRNEPEKVTICLGNGLKQERTVGNEAIRKEFSYNTGPTSTLLGQNYDEPVVYELPSDSSRLSLSDDSDSDVESGENVGDSSNLVKLNWFSSVNR